MPCGNLTVISTQGRQAIVREYGPVTIPDQAWRSGAARSALGQRDVAAILRLAQRYCGASQHRLAGAVAIPQGRLSEILKGTRAVTALEVFERIADGLAMPDHARVAMGLAPRRPDPARDTEPSFGEVVNVFRNQADAGGDIRAAARDAAQVQVLAVRGLGLVGLNDALLREVIHRIEPPAAVTILLSDPDAAGTVQRAAEVGESAESFASGIRLSVARLAELHHPQLSVYLYGALPVWRIVAVDDTLYVSAFAHWEGHESPTYKIVNTSGGALYHGFVRTLRDLRDRAKRVI
jgi:hypothetical protein